MRISSAGKDGRYVELEVAEAGFASDEAGALWIKATLLKYRTTARAPFPDQKPVAHELGAPVELRLRLDGFSVLHSAIEALASKGRKAKDGAVQVFVPKDGVEWKAVEP